MTNQWINEMSMLDILRHSLVGKRVFVCFYGKNSLDFAEHSPHSKKIGVIKTIENGECEDEMIVGVLIADTLEVIKTDIFTKLQLLGN